MKMCDCVAASRLLGLLCSCRPGDRGVALSLEPSCLARDTARAAHSTLRTAATPKR